MNVKDTWGRIWLRIFQGTIPASAWREWEKLGKDQNKNKRPPMYETWGLTTTLWYTVCASSYLNSVLAQSLYWWAMGWMPGVRIPAGARDLSLLDSVWTSSGACPASYPMITRGTFPEVKQPRREADHSPPSSAEVKTGGAIPPLFHMTSWCGA
jgi:hypothetical protein